MSGRHGAQGIVSAFGVGFLNETLHTDVVLYLYCLAGILSYGQLGEILPA